MVGTIYEGYLYSVRSSVADARAMGGSPEARELMVAPDWVQRDDDLAQLFQAQSRLVARGEIVWGAIIQANSLLFSPGPDSCPAQFIHSDDPRIDYNPDILRNGAHKVFSLKGQAGHEGKTQAVVDVVTDEMVRVFRQPVPTGLTEDIACIHSVGFVYRPHLPEGVLTGGLMPLYSLPSETDTVMMVPSWHWPEAFIDADWPRVQTPAPQPRQSFLGRLLRGFR